MAKKKQKSSCTQGRNNSIGFRLCYIHGRAGNLATRSAVSFLISSKVVPTVKAAAVAPPTSEKNERNSNKK